MIVIVDYNAGNIASIKNMLNRLNFDCIVSSNKKDISSASKLILPGVGNFDYGMNKLFQLDLIETLDNVVLVNKTPVLGICLGAQIMCKDSDEGVKNGLGWFDANVRKFDKNRMGEAARIPHVGWNTLKLRKKSRLLDEDDLDPRYYFVHSYHFQANDINDIVAESLYGYSFPCIFEKDNIFAVQFHPEKSHKYGMKLLSNFASL
jgi:glutamine amidotransferase